MTDMTGPNDGDYDIEGLVSESDVAIVGMAGRFPGAPTIEALWERVRNGEDCLTDLTESDLRAAGVDDETLASSEYVRRSGIVEGVDLFDPAFFGIGPRDAAIMDPQHRHFIECVWEAIESAGYVPEKFPGAIGVFGGCGANTYMLNNLLSNRQLLQQVGWFLLRHTGNDKDFLTTGVSYRLDLRGPSINVQTACSTSLVAVHLASQSLLSFECDMAIAGGVTIEVPHGVGYQFHEGEILSPDGHCRAFDATSAGTVLASGAGAVVLRRATDALRDGDPILAIIKGSAVNNDGARKVGFLAPSVDGHADVVREALAVSGVDARSIGLIDAHGTGTAVGDPIEFTALTEAYRSQTDDNGFCRITSTKPNIGHLDTAAGVASLMKVVQSLRHQYLPPLANFTEPSPLLDVPSSPFELSGEGRAWTSDGPRRAGVSSLGVGGTNAHVIVEEAPALPTASPTLPEQIIALSARTDEALDRAVDRLATFLTNSPEISLGDVVNTLSVGRRDLAKRRVVVVTDPAVAVTELRGGDRRRTTRATVGATPPGVAFMFPGGGSQYPGMASALDERFTEFHQSLDDGIRLVKKHSGLDLAPLLKPDGDADALRQPTASLPAVFITEVALARQWMAWGVQPKMLVGHSLGEYTAAHLAGVLSFDDAVKLVVTRAALMERVGGENAAMMAVPMPEGELRALLPVTLSLATVNAADECVISGLASEVDAFTIVLAGQGVTGSRIPLAAAAHSSLLDPVLGDFAAVVRTVQLSAPTVRYLSNLTGTWITPEQATDPQYWVDHLRGTVRFSDGLAAALATGPLVLVELGPGQSLSSYARRQETKPVAVIPGLRHPADAIDDTVHVLAAFAKLWAFGVPVDLTATIGPGGPRRRLRMPTYPFDRERYWIEPGMLGMGAAGTGAIGAGTNAVIAAVETSGTTRIERLEDWCWEPIWREAAAAVVPTGTVGPWLLLADANDTDALSLATELRRRGESVRTADTFAPELLGGDPAPGVTAIDDTTTVRAIAVFSPMRDGTGANVADTFERARARLLHDASLALRGLANGAGEGRFVVVTRGAVSADDVAPRAVEAMALGPVLVGPREYPDVQTLLVDVLASEMPDPATLADELLGASGPVVARRRSRRLAPDLQRRVLPATSPAAVPFRNGGTYVVTGALGGIGHSIASHLATNHHANLVVVSSEPLPAPHERAYFLSTHSPAHPTSRRLQRLAALETDGSRVLAVSADLSDPESLRAALDEAETTFGRIDGAVHAAGRLVDRPLETVTAEDQEAVIGAKARGAVVLADELGRRSADHLVLVSSTSTSLAPGGQSSYVAANAVLDSLAGAHGNLRVVTIDYGVWAGTGMAAAAARRARLGVEDGEAIEHPVLAERRIDRNGGLELTGRIDAKTDWIVDEHRVSSGVAVLPGTGHLELMLAALRHAGTALSSVPHALANVSLLEPLVVPDDHAVMVRVTIGPPEPDGTRLVRVESDGGLGRVWYVHSEAEIVPAAARPAPAATPTLRNASPIDPLIGPRRHLRLGGRWDAVTTASATADAVVARLALRSGIDDASAWCAHPALVDVATACGVALGTATGDVLYVPVGYDTVTSYAPLGDRVTVAARRQPSSTPDLLRVDLSFVTPDGELALEIAGLSLRPVADPGRFAAPVDSGAARATGRVSQLLELAEDLGIRESEGVELFERVVASGASRLVVSSVELDDLRDDPAKPDTGARSSDQTTGSGGGLLDVLAEAWGDLLGVSPIGLDDDFFELGGHSLIAIRLMTRIHKTIGVRLQLATLFEAPTIRKLADVLLLEKPELASLGQSGNDTVGAKAALTDPTTGASASSPASTRHPSIVPIRAATTDERPLFLIHGAGGNVLNLWGLAKQLPAGRAVYGIQAHGIDGSVAPDNSVEQMAERYIEAVRSVQPHGPYLLGGYSGGGVVALHMSNLLAADRERVAKVIMLDTVPRLSDAPGGVVALKNAAINAVRCGPGAVLPWFWYVLVQKFSRKTIDLDAFGLGFGDTSDLGFVNLETHFATVIDAYQFGTYDVDALIVEAEKVFAAWPWHYGWKGKIRGHIERVIVPGDHFEMFTTEHAPVVARSIAPYLTIADDKSTQRADPTPPSTSR
jgi:acyl transferase domain-containing protein/thioesterase domain-containing protein/NAD(P)-dependent dehydrogenase (short-subunit alcohol dehydrogenase family)/acyl carrier protein